MEFGSNSYLFEKHTQNPPRSRFEIAREAYLADRSHKLLLESKAARQRKHERWMLIARRGFAHILRTVAIKLRSAAKRLEPKRL